MFTDQNDLRDLVAGCVKVASDAVGADVHPATRGAVIGQVSCKLLDLAYQDRDTQVLLMDSASR